METEDKRKRRVTDPMWGLAESDDRCNVPAYLAGVAAFLVIMAISVRLLSRHPQVRAFASRYGGSDPASDRSGCDRTYGTGPRGGAGARTNISEPTDDAVGGDRPRLNPVRWGLDNDREAATATSDALDDAGSSAAPRDPEDAAPDFILPADVPEDGRPAPINDGARKTYEQFLSPEDKFDISRSLPPASVSSRSAGSLSYKYGPSLEEVQERMPNISEIIQKPANGPRYSRVEMAALHRAETENTHPVTQPAATVRSTLARGSTKLADIQSARASI